ncbi:MAG: ribokinase [Gammaproteobacteria bacterium]|nr:ribokinase [Gammaproteobacteria bacterium]
MNAPNQQIHIIGSINTDLVISAGNLPAPGQSVLGGEFLMCGGGKGANQAVAAARLGAKVSMVGCVGDDLFGNTAMRRLQEEGINCSGIVRHADVATGVALIHVDSQGENQIMVAPGANNLVNEKQIVAALQTAERDSVILLQMEIPLAIVEAAVREAKSKSCRIILDPAPAAALPSETLAQIFLLTPNQSEAAVLTGVHVDSVAKATRAAEALLERGVTNAAITLGANGVLLATESSCELIAAPKVQAVDSTAAGDCFCGAVSVALIRGASLPEAVHFACQAAAISVTRSGAQQSLPTDDQVHWSEP